MPRAQGQGHGIIKTDASSMGACLQDLISKCGLCDIRNPGESGPACMPNWHMSSGMSGHWRGPGDETCPGRLHGVHALGSKKSHSFMFDRAFDKDNVGSGGWCRLSQMLQCTTTSGTPALIL
jgi:hypothetical protein